jgi:hypothetical protein
VELHLHPPYISMVWYLVKHRDDFSFHVSFMRMQSVFMVSTAENPKHLTTQKASNYSDRTYAVSRRQNLYLI